MYITKHLLKPRIVEIHTTSLHIWKHSFVYILALNRHKLKENIERGIFLVTIINLKDTKYTNSRPSNLSLLKILYLTSMLHGIRRKKSQEVKNMMPRLDNSAKCNSWLT